MLRDLFGISRGQIVSTFPQPQACGLYIANLAAVKEKIRLDLISVIVTGPLGRTS